MVKERPILEQLSDKVKGYNYFNNIIERCPELDITFLKLYDLYYIVAGANFNLADANNELISLDEYETNDSDILRTFLRSGHLKSCILAYNSVEDYVMQIINFAFNLKGKRLTSKKDYRSKSKNNYYYEVQNKVEKNNYTELNNLIKSYHEDHNIKKIRELANNLKHNNNIQFNELPKPTYMNFNIERKFRYRSEWIQPKSESLDEIIDICYAANIIIKNYIDELYSILNDKYNLDKIN